MCFPLRVNKNALVILICLKSVITDLYVDKDNENSEDPDVVEKRKKHKRIRPITIVPICKYRRQHIRIDTEALYRIVMALKWLPRKANNPKRNIDYNEFLERQSEFWVQYFDMDKINSIQEKNRKKTKFHYQLQSDGNSVSILYETQLSEHADNVKRLESIKRKFESGFYKYQVGIDLGYNTYIAAVRRNPESNKEVITKIKSKQFHRTTKNNIRKKRFLHLAGDFERRAAVHRQQFPVPPSPRGVHYWTYIDHCLQFWAEGVQVYTTPQYTRLAFDKYTNTQSAMDKITNKITNRSPTLLFIGGAEFSPNSPIKGHVRCPGVRKITKCLKKWKNSSDVIFVDEFNTSQHCARCCRRFDASTKRNRYKICSSCTADNNLLPAEHIVSKSSRGRLVKYTKAANCHNTIWHRDIAAAKLILIKGLKALSGEEIHTNLSRPRNLNSDDDEDIPPSIIW